ncbi:MAG: glycosyl transferase [Cytophagia bacterium]|nr:glycosyl transferase [Cytophagia bacterium]
MIFQILISLFLSIIIIKNFISFLKKYFLDLPNHRSSHTKPIPRAGGISFVICGSFFALLNGSWFILICIPLSIVSLIDDFKELNPLFRYIIQAFTSLSLIITSQLYFDPIQKLPIISQLCLIFLLTILGTGIINFLNFMDGIDGILAACMIIVFVSLGIKFLPSLFPLVAAILGFLLFNWQPAKVFMGDSGSTFIGAVFVGSIFQISNSINDFKVIFLAAPLLFDAFSCLVRRFYIGENIFKPHKLHLYQRLNQAGFSHQKVSLIYLAATLILSLSYLLGNKNIYLVSIVSITLFGILLDRKYAYPFKKSHISNG